MKPRDEIATIVAGTVIAETFELIDSDGNLVAQLNETSVPEEARFLRMVTSENQALKDGLLQWDFVAGDPLPDVGVSMSLGFEDGPNGITIHDGIGFTAYDIELNGQDVHASNDLSVQRDLDVGGGLSAGGTVSFCPCGTIIEGVWTSAPSGFAFLNGQTLVNAQTDYPLAWAVFPTAWRSGSNLVLPNIADRTTLATNSTPGGLAGSNTHTIARANLPPHQHDMSHQHSGRPWWNSGGVDEGATFGFSSAGASPPFAAQYEAAHATWSGYTDSGLFLFNEPVDHTPAHMKTRKAIRLV